MLPFENSFAGWRSSRRRRPASVEPIGAPAPSVLAASAPVTDSDDGPAREASVSVKQRLVDRSGRQVAKHVRRLLRVRRRTDSPGYLVHEIEEDPVAAASRRLDRHAMKPVS